MNYSHVTKDRHKKIFARYCAVESYGYDDETIPVAKIPTNTEDH